MFTLKLFVDGERRSTLFVSAARITVAEEGLYLKSLSCHAANSDDAEVYFVGVVTESTAFAAIDGRVFDRAVIENAEGRTTEIVRVRAVPPASEVHRSPSLLLDVKLVKTAPGADVIGTRRVPVDAISESSISGALAEIAR